MKKKILLLGCVILLLSCITFLFVNAKTDSIKSTTNTKLITTEQTSATCDPSHCSKEDAAKCPYNNSSVSTSEASVICPATKDCPPSKCMGDNNQKKATL